MLVVLKGLDYTAFKGCSGVAPSYIYPIYSLLVCSMQLSIKFTLSKKQTLS